MMALFFVLLVDENAGNEPISDISFQELKPCAMPAQKIETMKQKVRTHRAALDFDHRSARQVFVWSMILITVP